MANSINNLENHLGYWLRFVSNHVSHAFRRKVEAQGVTVAEWVVMRTLFDVDSINPSDMADKIGLTRGAVSKLVDRLAKKRFVRCQVDKADRRYQLVTLAKSGRKLVPVLAALADDNDAEFFGHLNNDEQAYLSTALRDIVHRHGLNSIPID